VTRAAGDTGRAFRLPAILLGIGLGGFFDGIVLHQILQWHHMASELYPPDSVANLQLNTTLDGLFHAFTWVVTLAGVGLMWRAAGSARTRPSTGTLVGGLLAGWGLFNVVEGLINHGILRILRDGPHCVCEMAAAHRRAREQRQQPPGPAAPRRPGARQPPPGRCPVGVLRARRAGRAARAALQQMLG
jgi:uncharacterized membrane protein